MQSVLKAKAHTVEYISPSSLKPHPKNPRLHGKKQIMLIADNIEAHGFNSPILIDEHGVVLAGHGRLAAALKIGLDHVPTIKLSHLNEEQKLAYLIADNKLTERGGWDKNLLSLNIQELLSIDYKVELTGYSTAEIDLSVVANKNEDSSPHNLATDNYEPVTRIGDLWLLGSHRIYCGNSLDIESYQTLLEGKKAQLVFTDPPYNVPIACNVKPSNPNAKEFVMASGELTSQQFTEFLRDFVQNAKSSCQEGSIIYICMDWRHIEEINSATKGLLEFKQLCVWAKDKAGMGSFYRSQHELIFIYKNGEAKHINNFGLGAEGRYRTNLWNYPVPTVELSAMFPEHPTPKPVSMVADAIRDCSKHNGIILDPFLGSGTTLIAAEVTRRKAYGIELDPTYVDISLLRWQEKTNKEPVHAITGLTFAQMKDERFKTGGVQ